MDGNKDDALKCFRIGKEALDGGDRTRAVKFLAKARRLDPSLPINDLLSSVEKDSDPPPPSDAAKPAGPPGSGLGMPPLRQRKASGSGSGSVSGSKIIQMHCSFSDVDESEEYEAYRFSL